MDGLLSNGDTTIVTITTTSGARTVTIGPDDSCPDNITRRNLSTCRRLSHGQNLLMPILQGSAVENYVYRM